MGNLTRLFAWTFWAIALFAVPSFVRGEEDYQFVSNALPKAMEGVGIDEKLGELVPTDLVFRDHRGNETSLSRVLANEKPLILTLNYSNCPGLCVTQLNGILQGINEVTSLKLGTDFYMVSVSIDPRESSEKAAGTQRRYSQDLFDQHDAAGWQFWTGSEEAIAQLTNAVGFRYTYDAQHNQYNHPAAAIFLAPNGKITRYLYELGFNGNTFKMAALEAGEGRIGTSMDMIALWCVHYNPMENRYSASARRLLSIFAGFFVVIGLVASIPFWLSRRHRLSVSGSAAKSSDEPTFPVQGTAAMEAAGTAESIRRTTNDILTDKIQS
jgi:protein SCO1/2